MQLTTTKRNTKKGRRAPQKILTTPFSHISENSPHFFLHFNLETCVNASSPKARRGVSSLSLILLFYCYHCAWCEHIYRERDERGNLEPTREKQKKRSRGEFYFSSKALLLQNNFSSKPNHHRALERNER